jgi:hypothetical protein
MLRRYLLTYEGFHQTLNKCLRFVAIVALKTVYTELDLEDIGRVRWVNSGHFVGKAQGSLRLGTLTIRLPLKKETNCCVILVQECTRLADTLKPEAFLLPE